MLKLQIFETEEGELYREYIYIPYVTWIYAFYYSLRPRRYIVVWLMDMDDKENN